LWLPVLFLPCTLFAGTAIVRAWRDPGRRPLVLWAAFVPMLLTLPRGKLATYALSALVPLALIGGPELARMVDSGPDDDEERLVAVAGWVIVAFLAGVAGA